MLQSFHGHHKGSVSFKFSGVDIKNGIWSLFPYFINIPLQRVLSRSTTMKIRYENRGPTIQKLLVYTTHRNTCVHSPIKETAHPKNEKSGLPSLCHPPMTLTCMPGCHTNKSFITLCIQALWSKKPSPIRLDLKRPVSTSHSAHGTMHDLSSHSSLIDPQC